MTQFLNKAFRRRLRNERERLGYSQKDFAEMAGIKRVSQYLYENNEESAPNGHYFTAISKMGVDLYYLFFNLQNGVEAFHLQPKMLSDIYRLVDEIAVDLKGNPLPLNEREKFFNLLCAVYTGKGDEKIDKNIARRLLA